MCEDAGSADSGKTNYFCASNATYNYSVASASTVSVATDANGIYWKEG